MMFPYKTFKMQVDDHVFWVAQSTSLSGCVGQGDTLDEAVKELESNENGWIEAAEENGIDMPEIPVTGEYSFSGKLTLRLSPLQHQSAFEHSKEQGISLNQYLNDAVVYYNALCDKHDRSSVPSAHKERIAL